MPVTVNGKEYKLREDFKRAQVVVYVDNQPVFSSGEYRFSAEYLKRQAGLTGDQMKEVYSDYRNDYDRRSP